MPTMPDAPLHFRDSLIPAASCGDFRERFQAALGWRTIRVPQEMYPATIGRLIHAPPDLNQTDVFQSGCGLVAASLRAAGVGLACAASLGPAGLRSAALFLPALPKELKGEHNVHYIAGTETVAEHGRLCVRQHSQNLTRPQRPT